MMGEYFCSLPCKIRLDRSHNVCDTSDINTKIHLCISCALALESVKYVSNIFSDRKWKMSGFNGRGKSGKMKVCIRCLVDISLLLNWRLIHRAAMTFCCFWYFRNYFLITYMMFCSEITAQDLLRVIWTYRDLIHLEILKVFLISCLFAIFSFNHMFTVHYLSIFRAIIRSFKIELRLLSVKGMIKTAWSWY